MGRQRSDAEQQIADLLQTAKKSLCLSVAFLSRLDGTTQHLEVVESSVPFLFQEGYQQKQDLTLCQAVLDRKLPAVIPNLKDFPEAMKLPAARMPRLRSYVSVPVVLSDGELYGTFCAAGLTSDKDLTRRDKALMEVLASAAAVIIEPEVRAQTRRSEIEERLAPVLAAGGPVVALQPIVDLATGARVGAEALSRCSRRWSDPWSSSVTAAASASSPRASRRWTRPRPCARSASTTARAGTSAARARRRRSATSGPGRSRSPGHRNPPERSGSVRVTRTNPLRQAAASATSRSASPTSRA
jgi:hypothetical protein